MLADGKYYSDIFFERTQTYVGVNVNWQWPAATERAAYQSWKSQAASDHYYIGFPWASLIDVSQTSGATANFFQRSLAALAEATDKRSCRGKVFTVCQHIRWRNWIELFVCLGVTDLFVPHLFYSEQTLHGIRLHPFPLYPAQTHFEQCQVEFNFLDISDRPLFTSFIGAYQEGLYISDTRHQIFSESWPDDVLVKRRSSWHFDSDVYDHQVNKKQADLLQVEFKRVERAEYLRVLQSSQFALCPTGSGPSSIRIYESLALNVIPILLTNQLQLPGEEHLWWESAVIVEDSASGLKAGIDKAKKISREERLAMVAAGKLLFSEHLEPRRYGSLLAAEIAR